ncbi:MAG: hypothetical protein JWM68_2551 [Verrucomicrobiales bacterium]|nr:hypothetical protein [Verrucomicrobiales bacterium]
MVAENVLSPMNKQGFNCYESVKIIHTLSPFCAHIESGDQQSHATSLHTAGSTNGSSMFSVECKCISQRWKPRWYQDVFSLTLALSRWERDLRLRCQTIQSTPGTAHRPRSRANPRPSDSLSQRERVRVRESRSSDQGRQHFAEKRQYSRFIPPKTAKNRTNVLRATPSAITQPPKDFSGVWAKMRWTHRGRVDVAGKSFWRFWQKKDAV